MPAYDVTVQATFKKTDAQILAEVADLLEGRSYTVDQATANTIAQISAWLAQQISPLFPDGVSIVPDGLSIEQFVAAVAGSASTPNGVNGSFNFTVTLGLNAATATTAGIDGEIIAQRYTPPVVPEEIFYTLSIPDVEGLIMNMRPGVYEVSEYTYVTLTFQAAEGYSLDELHVYANGAEQTLTGGNAGAYELVLGYLNSNVTITVEGVKQSSPGVGVARPSDLSLKAVKADGGLYVYGLTPGLEFRIYNVAGALVYKGKATSTEQFVPISGRGFHVLVSGGVSVKVVF
jgi:hypothetical protein